MHEAMHYEKLPDSRAQCQALDSCLEGDGYDETHG